METPENSPFKFFQSNTMRLIMVGGLTLVLLIPLLFVQNLINERAQRQKEVVAETSGKWGKSVYCYGPILKVPYRMYDESETVDEKTKAKTTQRTASTQFAYFFPETLNAAATVDTRNIHRNLYESTVFTAQTRFTGHYVKPDFSLAQIADADIFWDKATIVIKTTNLESIRDEVKIALDGKSYAFEPIFADAKDSVAALETPHVDLTRLRAGGKMDFKFDIQYNGSGQFKLVPIGKTTTLKMKADWGSPSFTGRYLPSDATKKITDSGFIAHWKVLHVNRAFGQQTFGFLPDLSAFGFGVDFVIPVDQYQQSERAAKYGFLVIGLTFLVFFFVQMVSKVRIHLFQYTMIGLALVLFYTLLISITEHSSFSTAYAVAAGSVVSMIGLYGKSVLHSAKFAGFIAGALSVLYSFIYVIIQLEEYALLVGSIGLFAILGAVMYFSRRIDWN